MTYHHAKSSRATPSWMELPDRSNPNAVLVSATNVQFVRCPANEPDIPNVTGNRWADYWPGDAYVDRIGNDTYDLVGPTTHLHNMDTFYSAYATGKGKPYMFGVRGLEPLARGGGGDDPAYIYQMLNWQAARPYVKALVCFSGWAPHGDYTLTESPNSAARMTERYEQPQYLNTKS